MEYLRPPGPMNFKTVNATDTWDKGAECFKNYFKTAKLKKRDGNVQVAILLELAGPDSLAMHLEDLHI